MAHKTLLITFTSFTTRVVTASANLHLPLPLKIQVEVYTFYIGGQKDKNKNKKNVFFKACTRAYFSHLKPSIDPFYVALFPVVAVAAFSKMPVKRSSALDRGCVLA